MKIFISSYHLAAAPTRYPPMIWNLLCSDHLLASAILLYRFNHSLGSSASVSLNSVSLTCFYSLSIWFTPICTEATPFINAIAFESVHAASPARGGLEPLLYPPLNPGGSISGKG